MSKLCFLFCIFILFLRTDLTSSRTVVGTVLFAPSDVRKQCWSPEEISILTTRMILEDVLPDVKILNIDCNDFVDDIVEYFRFLINVVRSSIRGRKRHITLLALTDLLGGYLHHAVLPIARAAYYAGIIDYAAMEKLIELFEEIKYFLRSSGQGWSTPLINTRMFDISTIDIQRDAPQNNKSCCGNLIYYQHPPIKKRCADPEKEKEKERSDTSVFFPMPFLDSKFRPTAIAVPFKRYALRSIESKKAAYMVLKYYISVSRCMRDLRASELAISKFQNNLFSWIETEVLPKLGDDKFYSAFGGILRIEETLKNVGAVMNKEATCEPKDEEGEEEVGAVPGGETSTRSSMVLMGMLILIFVWFIIGTLFICYRIRASNLKAKEKGSGGPGELSSCTCSSTGGSSKFSMVSKSTKRTTDTSCRCRCTSLTEKSTVFSSSQSSECDEPVRKMKVPSCRPPPPCYPSSKRQQSFSSPSCICDSPAIIETKHSMKVLPSIPEISENSSTKKDYNRSSRRISFGHPLATSSVEDISITQMDSMSSKIKVCMPKQSDPRLTLCPHYSDKATSLSSSRSKSLAGKDLGTQMSGDSFICAKDSKGSTTDDTGLTGITANSPHIYACHSSLTGNYARQQKFSPEKPYIFGYDFQTTSSSDVSDEDSDVRTSTSK